MFCKNSRHEVISYLMHPDPDWCTRSSMELIPHLKPLVPLPERFAPLFVLWCISMKMVHLCIDFLFLDIIQSLEGKTN